MFMAKVFLFFFVCLLVACENSISKSENKVLTAQTKKVVLNLRMERTHCFGECPVYILTIQPDGNFFFENIKIRVKDELITKKEKIEGKLGEEKINQIVVEINKADFFKLKDSYTDGFDCPAFWKDSPDLSLSVSLDGKEKTISHSLGCKEKVDIDEEGKIYPQQLYELENKIDEIVETKRWIGERK